jgi:hypothetical protein
MPFNSIGTVTAVGGGSTPYTAPSGSWQQPPATASAGAALTSGRLTFHPFDVGPNAKVFTALGVGVTTAQSGGAVALTLAAYPDDGSGGQPLLTGGPAVSGPVTGLTAMGAAIAPVAWTAQPGRYWLAALYVATSAPTTAPAAYALTAAPTLWAPPSSGPSSANGIQAGAVYGDTFTKANSTTSLGSTNAGTAAAQAWTYSAGLCGILNNTARAYTAYNSNDCVAVQAVGSSAGTHQVTLAAVNLSDLQTIACLLFRSQGTSSSGIQFGVYGSGSGTPVYALQAAPIAGAPAPAAGDVLQVIDTGTAYSCFVNGARLTSGTSSSTNTSGGIVLQTQSTPGSAGLTNWSWSTNTTPPGAGGPGPVAQGLAAVGQTAMPTTAITLTTTTAPVLVAALAA